MGEDNYHVREQRGGEGTHAERAGAALRYWIVAGSAVPCRFEKRDASFLEEAVRVRALEGGPSSEAERRGDGGEMKVFLRGRPPH